MKKFLKWFFVTVFVFVVAIAAGGYYFLSTFDLNKYKTQIAALVEKEIGRTLSINGDARLGISFIPTLIVNDITLSNAEFSPNPYMVTLEQVEIQVSILPLLKKQIVLNNVSLIKPEIFLDVSKQGVPNWQFKSSDVESVSEPSSNPAIEKVKEQPALALLAGFVAKNVSIKNGSVVYNDMSSEKEMALDIRKFEVNAPNPDETMKVNLDVVFDEQPIKGMVELGSINSIAAGKPLELKVALEAYGAHSSVLGVVTDYLESPKFDLSVALTNPKGNFGAPKINFAGGVKGDLKKIDVTLDILDVAKNVITGQISADISGIKPFVSANLKSDLINLLAFSEPAKTAALDFSLISSANATELVPNEAIPYDLMKLVNAKLDLSIGKLIVSNDMEASNVSLNASLVDGVLRISPLSMGFGEGRVTLAASVDANARTAALNASSQGVLIQKLSREFAYDSQGDFGIESGGALDIDINLSTRGDTYRQLAETLDGRTIAIVGQSQVKTGKVRFLKFNLIDQVLQLLKLNEKKFNEIDLVCSVVRADLKSGKVVFPEGIAIESKQINFMADGKISLINDNIDFSMQPSFPDAVDANITGAVTSFLRIQGTIQDPKIALDNKAAVKAIVGMTTNAPVYVGSQLLANSNSSPCYSALVGTAHESRFPKPTGVKATTENVYKDTAKAVENSVKEIKTNAKESVKELKSSAKNILNAVKGKK